MHQELGRSMIKLICGNAFQKSNFIGHRLEMRQIIAYPCTALAILIKTGLRTQHFGNPANESKFLPFQKRIRTGLTVHFMQLWLIIKKFELRRSPGPMKIEHRTGFGCKLRSTGKKWV